MSYRIGLTMFPGVDLDRELEQDLEEIFQMFQAPKSKPKTDEETKLYRQQIEMYEKMSRSASNR